MVPDHVFERADRFGRWLKSYSEKVGQFIPLTGATRRKPLEQGSRETPRAAMD